MLVGEKAPGGVEPSTFCLLDRRSNQLSYGADNTTPLHHKLELRWRWYINVMTRTFSTIKQWPRGLMDKASDFESEDCEFESRRGRFL